MSEFTIKYFLRVGKAIQLIDMLFDEDYFSDLSKHNPAWDSQHPKEADALEDLRIRLSSISYRLEEIQNLLTIEEYKDD